MIGMKNQKNSLVISEGRSSLWWKGLVENVRFQPGLKEWWRSKGKRKVKAVYSS